MPYGPDLGFNNVGAEIVDPWSAASLARPTQSELGTKSGPFQKSYRPSSAHAPQCRTKTGFSDPLKVILCRKTCWAANSSSKSRLARNLFYDAGSRNQKTLTQLTFIS
jgi:hypothetical protein